MDYVLDTLLESLSELVDCESARVLLLETDTRLFLARKNLSPNGVERPSRYPLTLNAADFPLLRHILESKKSALLADTELHKEWKAFTGQANVRSWLGVPLLASKQTLGLLSIGSDKPNSSEAGMLITVERRSNADEFSKLLRFRNKALCSAVGQAHSQARFGCTCSTFGTVFIKGQYRSRKNNGQIRQATVRRLGQIRSHSCWNPSEIIPDLE